MSMNLETRITRMCTQKRIECRKRDLAFDLDFDWYLDRVMNGCELSGLHFKMDSKGGSHPLSPSVDRIDSNGGYTKDNCRMIVLGLNMMKSNSTDDVLMKICEAVVSKDSNSTREIAITEFFTERQTTILNKKLDGDTLTKTEAEYFSKVIKKRITKYAKKEQQWARNYLMRLN